VAGGVSVGQRRELVEAQGVADFAVLHPAQEWGEGVQLKAGGGGEEQLQLVLAGE
jgi:hypothetical protein